MKKIAYIELDTHAEIAQKFMELMRDSEDFSVDYFFSEKILKSFDFDQGGILPENIKKTTAKNIKNQLLNIHYDLVIIGTVHRYFNIFGKIADQFNTSIIIHNLNFTKISKSQLLKNIFKKDILFRLKLLWKENLLSVSNIFKKAKNLLVLDEKLKCFDDKKHQFLPIFFNQFNPRIASETFTIVIPGAVSQERRDYQMVLKKLMNFKTKFEVIFLGKAFKKELNWLEDFEKNKPENITITYFTEKVPQDIFDANMKKATVLWCPIQAETEFFSNEEVYGKTKMSGNIGDAIKYGKLAIFPAKYRSDLEFIFNQKEDLETQFLSLKNTHFDFQKDFNIAKIREKLEFVLAQIT